MPRALSVVEKPTGLSQQSYEALATRRCDQLVLMSQVKVIRQRIDRGVSFGPRRSAVIPVPSPGPFHMLGVVASTGGPNALTQILGGLPANIPLPILLVQHITASFLDGFVSWLGGVCPFSVRLARDGEIPAPATVYLSPADRHSTCRRAVARAPDGRRSSCGASSVPPARCCSDRWPAASVRWHLACS